MTAVTDLWAFVTDPTNRETLSWIGGSLIAIGGVALAMLKRITRKGKSMDNSEASKAPSVQNQAGRDVTAAGGDISQNSGNTTTTVTGLTGRQLIAILALLSGVALLVIPWIGGNVSATNGSTAIGGDVSGSTVTTGK